jgi:hypothetical protein
MKKVRKYFYHLYFKKPDFSNNISTVQDTKNVMKQKVLRNILKNISHLGWLDRDRQSRTTNPDPPGTYPYYY